MHRTLNKNNIIFLFRLLLLPFSLLFFIIVTVRNIFFNLNIFRSANFSKPVISAGNISTGGTGKTPFVIYLAKYYLEKGYRPGIVTKGYKGKSKEPYLVSNGKQIFGNTDITGDEAQLIAAKLSRNYSNFSVCTSKSKKKGISFLINNEKPDLIILDDAFQNRWIKRDIDLVLIDTGSFDDFYEKVLLPSGNLRETRSSIKRADFIIANNKFSSRTSDTLKLPINRKKHSNPAINISYIIEDNFKKQSDIYDLINKQAIVFCGIARPDSFLKTIEKTGIHVKKYFSYKDHHNYEESDVQLLASIYENNDIFLTTEKDFVKIKRFKNFCDNYPVFTIGIDIEITKNKELLENNLISLLGYKF